ncbi:hypothetical protein VTK73DRAFT_10302 [Phialemonium thermophilum]|uniref:Carbohydrate kinase PfkB domain-containing protein n=1 Tax=Phialemonium thermophilum TaxID=223376 RepID=A0ABR3VXC5_9PEZI
MIALIQGRIPETTLQCIRYLRRELPESRVSVEVEKPNREGLRELAAEADLVFYSRTWAEVSHILTIGAGDTFVAGILFGVACHRRDWDLEQKLRFAVDLATRKVQIDGFAGLI